MNACVPVCACVCVCVYVSVRIFSFKGDPGKHPVHRLLM